MGGVMMFVALAACLGVAGILAFGIGGFGSGKMSPRRQNKMMQYRIIGQAVAVALMLLAVTMIQSCN